MLLSGKLRDEQAWGIMFSKEMLSLWCQRTPRRSYVVIKNRQIKWVELKIDVEEDIDRYLGSDS